MTIKALIFDFDGVLTDTEPIHMDAWLSALEPLGISFTLDDYKKYYIGLNDRDFLDEIGRRASVHFEDIQKTDLIAEKAAICMKSLEHSIPTIPGVKEFIEEASSRYLMAICSGALRNEIEFILKRMGIMDKFSPIISSESVGRGKPDPEGYIRALEGIQERSSTAILADEVAAVEDSPKGVVAAHSAGLKCVAVTNSYHREMLSSADLVVDSLLELDLSVL